jgi:hypothetical protein
MPDRPRRLTILLARLAVFFMAGSAVAMGVSRYMIGCFSCSVAGQLDSLSGARTPETDRVSEERRRMLERTRFGPFPHGSLGVEEFIERPGGDTAKASVVLRRLISEQPALAEAWQGLAEVMIAGGRGASEALPLVQVSRLLGPKEGRLMVRRAIFGIANWDLLDARQRSATVTEAVQTASSLAEAYQVTLIRDALRRQNPDTRQAIMIQMAASVPYGPGALQRLGLN